ncbi:MAG: hypothetical protein BGO41_15040 [Clostridiales bacterium 38-18]|nr:MAG: hypothetical protein BGO41_15040 [Clostridiales bacterium 38-18]
MWQRNKLILLISLVALITGVGIISQLNKTDFSNNLDDVYIRINQNNWQLYQLEALSENNILLALNNNDQIEVALLENLTIAYTWRLASEYNDRYEFLGSYEISEKHSFFDAFLPVKEGENNNRKVFELRVASEKEVIMQFLYVPIEAQEKVGNVLKEFLIVREH